MANTLLRTVIDDIVLDLKQTDDDTIVQRTQIAYWILMLADRLKSQHILKRSSGAFLSTFIVPVVTFTDNLNPNQIKNQKHFILPKTIYDFDRDEAINFLAYYDGDDCIAERPRLTKVHFSRTTPKASLRLYSDKDEQPAPETPYFYRVHEIIYALGIEEIAVENLVVGLFTTFDPVTTIDIDEPFDFPEELYAVLKRQVLDLGRFSLLIPQERINDGTDIINPGAVPTNKLVSVNEPAISTQAEA